MTQEDTICAIATPAGTGGIGVIRVSGPEAVRLCAPLVRLRRGQSLSDVQSHHLHLADVVLPSTVQSPIPSVATTLTETARPLDQALVVVMRAPRSYTGELVVELHCHSGPVLLRSLCVALIQQGARLADPGEFTKRAFLNGRLDLTQAEGVLETIEARTGAGLRLAQELLRGRLSEDVARVQGALSDLLAHVEAGIDFVEEDIEFVSSAEAKRQVEAALLHVESLLRSWEYGRLAREGAKVVLVGKPNVGKSSLLNALLRCDRAIVTAIPGTTRDTLEETLSINGIPFRLCDTAGLRETQDLVEAEGVRRTEASMDEADLLLLVVDGSCPLDEEDRRLLSASAGRRRVIVVSKLDLGDGWPAAELDLFVLPGEASGQVPVEAKHGGAVVRTSVRTGEGIEALRQAIVASFPLVMESQDGVVVTRLRHRDALARTREALLHVRAGTEANVSPELLAVDLRAALHALGELTGAVTTDDLLDKIFSEFCIGK